MELTKQRIVFDENLRGTALKVKRKRTNSKYENESLPLNGFYVISYVSSEGNQLYMYGQSGEKTRITMDKLEFLDLEVMAFE